MLGYIYASDLRQPARGWIEKRCLLHEYTQIFAFDNISFLDVSHTDGERSVDVDLCHVSLDFELGDVYLPEP